MKVQISFEWTVQRASEEVCQQLNKPAGTFEVLDGDGDRYCFAETEAEAIQDVRDYVAENMGMLAMDVTVAEIDSSGGSSVVG